MTNKAVVLFIAAALLLTSCAAPQPARPFAATYPTAAVACDHPAASAAGAEILRAGGNAVDAAVAASFTLSVVRPYSCGLGGGGFMVIHLAQSNTNSAINYRERAPQAVDPLFYTRQKDPKASTEGALGVGVPGTVAGLLDALEHFGRADRQAVLAPAIRAAEDGFVVDDHYFDSSQKLIERFSNDPALRARFAYLWEYFLLNGKVRVGDRIRNPRQAKALRLIAELGADAFYHGPIGEAIAQTVARDGGVLTLADLALFHVEHSAPIVRTIGGYSFVGMPPPSSGGATMIETLMILDALGLLPGSDIDDADGLHLMTEAMKHAFADRAEWFGDAAFVEVPIDRLTSPAYARTRAAGISPAHTRPPSVYGTREQLPIDAGTSHISVVDADGNAAACTETINLVFGSLLAVEEYGFLLNNEMDDFLTHPGAPNAFGLQQSERNLPAPGKRPLSSMSPTIVLDDAGVVAVAGASGGPRIITGTMQALIHALSGDDAGTAVARARAHHQWLPNRLDLEPGLFSDGALRTDLSARGHELGARQAIGNVQLIRRDPDGGWQAASDPRKGGRPAGY